MKGTGSWSHQNLFTPPHRSLHPKSQRFSWCVHGALWANDLASTIQFLLPSSSSAAAPSIRKSVNTNTAASILYLLYI